MDELDSALHPLMSKRLINVLYNYFHKELGINIVISTHSPSTVAFAPENSLYIMKKTGDNRLTKSSKDVALKELTFGVPSFSINYENRRQVFVESKYDVEYYESLYSIFKSKLNPEISLNFIASGDIQKDMNGQPKSNCDNVKNITKILREAGNQFVWGIIDWDLNSKKPDCEYVKVLGWQQRYSIENYLLDPLIIAIFLLLEKIKEPSDFGFKENFKIYSILTFDKNKIQQIIDSMINWLATKIEINRSKIAIYKTVNDIELSLPKQFMEYHGHKLEEKYLEVFPELNRIKKKGQDNTLKNAVIKKVIEEYEELAPKDLIEILKDVQEI